MCGYKGNQKDCRKATRKGGEVLRAPGDPWTRLEAHVRGSLGKRHERHRMARAAFTEQELLEMLTEPERDEEAYRLRVGSGI